MVGLRYADPVRMLTWKRIECCGPVKIKEKSTSLLNMSANRQCVAPNISPLAVTPSKQS